MLVRWCWLMLIALVMVATASRSARAQNSITEMAQQADSLRALNALPTDSLSVRIPSWVFNPTYKNYTEATINYYAMRNEMQTNLTTPWRAILNFQLKDDEKNYRLQNRLEKNKLLQLGMVQPMGAYVASSVTFTDSRVFNRSISLGGGVQDFIVNDQSIVGGVNYNRSFNETDVGDFRLSAGVSASANEGERTFKTDKTLAGGAFAGLVYEVGPVQLMGRANYRETDERSITALETLDGLGATEDSLVAGARIQVSDSAVFNVNYFDFNGDRLYADQRRGSQGGQVGGAEEVYREREQHPTERTTVSMTTHLFGSLAFDVMAYHEFNQFKYDTTTTRNSAVTDDGFLGHANYITPWRSTTAFVTFEGGSRFNDLSPNAVASLTENRKLVRVGVDHEFKPTLTLSLSGSTQLLQSLYLFKEDNPRDRDQLDSSVSARLNSVPFTNFSAFISASYTNSLFKNIDASQSANNRTRELYELRPGFSYFMSQYLIITQSYGIAIDYTQYKYLEASTQDDFLDRNFTFSNEFKSKPLKNVDLRFLYTLLVHDKGSYFEDILQIDQRDNRQETILGVDYYVKEQIRVFGENTYSRRVEEAVNIGDVDRSTTNGSIRVGVDCRYKFGDAGRKLDVYFARVKRFSPSGSEAEKNFWDARSDFVFPF